MEKKRILIVDDEASFTRMVKLTPEKTSQIGFLSKPDATLDRTSAG